MNSSKVVTEYPMVKGTLEWEIRNLGSRFKNCINCLESEEHSTCTSNVRHIDSVPMTLAAGNGKHSKWCFRLTPKWTNPGRFEFSLCFYGLFGSNGTELNEPISFHYNTVAKNLVGGHAFFNAYGTKVCNSEGFITLGTMPLHKMASIWPLGSLKITVQISHLLGSVQEVANNSQFLDFLDLKDSLSGCYGNLLNNPDLSDFKIFCDGSTFYAHKLILSVRSPVFRAMLESGMSESTKNELKIEDMTIQTLKLMLDYIYKGTIGSFPENVNEKIQLLDCAEKYELDGLKSICMRKLFSNPATEKEVGKLAMAAFTYGANERATKAIKEFCIKNHEKLIQNTEYKKLFLANPQAFVN